MMGLAETAWKKAPTLEEISLMVDFASPDWDSAMSELDHRML